MPNAKKYAERVNQGTMPGGGMFETWRAFGQELVNGEAVVDSVITAYQLGFAQADFHHFGLWIKADSVTTSPELLVHVLQSFDDSQENYAVYDTGEWVMDNIQRVFRLPISPMRFMRIRLIGQPGNPSDTFVDAYLFMQRA